MTDTGEVHVFLSRGRFSTFEEIRGYADERYPPDGDAEPSDFIREAGIVGFEPMCVETILARDDGHLAPVAPEVILRDASYADQWLAHVDSTELADAAICVFDPNVVTNPHGTSLHYLGRFTFRK